MNRVLSLKKSNCKNCYKCIRHCPVKSIRFSDGQANIVPDECILCGMCFVVCPQNAKQVRNDIPVVRQMLQSGKRVVASVAPSFIAEFPVAGFEAMRTALQQLGFADAEETAIGATIVKKEYERMVAGGERSVIISSCCHSINTLIQKHYPGALPYLADVLSPMLAHCRAIKEADPAAQTVFIGPCISKKEEADLYGWTDAVLTFEELEQMMAEEGVSFPELPAEQAEGKRARFFPTEGGVIKSMDRDPRFHYLAVTGVENCIEAIKEIEAGQLENCFVELSACEGRADQSMCLPYLKEKAETFSGYVINSSPNGIFVLDENLCVQQINRAACNLFNLKNPEDILGSPIVRILNPADYFAAMNSPCPILEKKHYLAEYNRYVAESIVYDKEYHIIFSIMRDITREEEQEAARNELQSKTVAITNEVIEKQMRVVQEIASLLGETTAETKIALTRLKDTLQN